MSDDLLPDEVRNDNIQLDPTKVTVDISECGYTVDELQSELFERYNIQVEKSTFNTLSLLLTIGTTRSKVSRLYDALMRIAREGRSPRRLYRTPEIPGFTHLKYLPRDAFYCGGITLPIFDEAIMTLRWKKLTLIQMFAPSSLRGRGARRFALVRT